MFETSVANYGFLFPLFAFLISNLEIREAMFGIVKMKYVFTIPYFPFVIPYIVLVFPMFVLSSASFEKKIPYLWGQEVTNGPVALILQ
jgi:hypothetical protein